MDFSQLDLKNWYDSDEDDIINDFLIPVLSVSKKYRRLSGYFSSSSLAISARGILNLLRNEGCMELVTSPFFTQKDIDIIRQSTRDISEISSDIMLRELQDIDEGFFLDHVKALGWMIKNNLLKIKIVIPVDKNGLPSESNKSHKGVFHLKVGIMEDNKGNVLSFSGSDNESLHGWKINIEEFKVFRNWIAAECNYYVADEYKYNKYWNNKSFRSLVIDLPDAVENRMLSLSPNNLEDINLQHYYKKKTKDIEYRLRDYQMDAVNSWVNNGFNGILEMSTGSGKTITSIFCIKKLMSEHEKLVIIVSSPFNHLIEQWKNEVNKFDLTTYSLIADGRYKNWRNDLADKLFDVDMGIINNILIYTTHNTFSSKDFINIIKASKQRSKEIKFLLLVDEVHGIGSPKRKEGLIEDYDYRLGLSATPKRWFDDEGTDKIFSYFNEVVYHFTLEDAIKLGHLTSYNYKPYFVNLTSDELEEYKKQTNKLSKMYYASKDDKEKMELYSLLCILRQQIIRNAENKLYKFQEILSEIQNIKHCLVYCSPQQILEVQDILNKRNIIQHKFTQVEGIKGEAKYGGLSEREFLLNKFSEGVYRALVSMRCLDEGVDIPPARLAIMLDNSGNPREYIQRRGRILRNYPGKTIATIYDIIVSPYPPEENLLNELESKIILNELKRYEEFSRIAENSKECLRIIGDIKTKYGLDDSKCQE